MQLRVMHFTWLAVGNMKEGLKNIRIIKEFTGISAPYEVPPNPKIHVRTNQLSLDDCVRKILDHLTKHNYIPSR